MEIETTRFGNITLTNKIKIFAFAEGLLGFPDQSRYVVLDNPSGGVFQWLQSTEIPELAFVVCDPLSFMSDYQAPVTRGDLTKVGAKGVEDVIVRCIVTVPDNPQEMTANLQGPIIFNHAKMFGRQLVLPDDLGFNTRHRIIPEGKKC